MTVRNTQYYNNTLSEQISKSQAYIGGSVLKTFKQLELYHLKLQAGSGTFQTFKTLLALCNYESCDFIPTLLSE